MTHRYRNIGRQTLEVVEVAPLTILKELLRFRDADNAAPTRLAWLEAENEDEVRDDLLRQVEAWTADDAQPIEDRSIRIKNLAQGKGPTSLDHVVGQRLTSDQHATYASQPDDLCRSAWVYLHHPAEFADAEAFHGLRQYREHGKMYDSFEIDADAHDAVTAESIEEAALALLLAARLQLPPGVKIRTINLPRSENHPPSVLVIARHAGPLSSVYSFKDDGRRSPIYYRPPNEATLIWTPVDNAIEVCGPSPQVRKSLGDCFAESVLGADLSKKPLAWRYYDLSRFHESFDLELPAWDDVEISVARLIEIEMRLGNWARRLSLRVTIDDDVESTARRYLGGAQLRRYAEGFSKLVVAVKYRRLDGSKERSLEISFGDRRSNLQSKDDPAQRDLGYRLLTFWGVLNRLQVLKNEELEKLLPQFLELYDRPEDVITGGQLRRVGLDAKRLLDVGILTFKKRQTLVLLDDGDDFGDVRAETLTPSDEALAEDVFGRRAGTVPAEDLRHYIIKQDWLTETIISALKPLLGHSRYQSLHADLGQIGELLIDGLAVPVYFARRIELVTSLQELDVLMRSRQDAGIGIVLSASRVALKHLGPNVVVVLSDLFVNGQLADDAASRLQADFKAGRRLALGGAEVTLLKFETGNAMLYIPGKPPLAVYGSQKIQILDVLVAAHKAGVPECRTGDVIAGTGARTPGDAWPSNVRQSIVGTYFENSSRGHWRLKLN